MGWGIRLAALIAAILVAPLAAGQSPAPEPDAIVQARTVKIGRIQPFAVAIVEASLARKTTTLAFYVIPPGAGGARRPPTYLARLIERQLVTDGIDTPGERAEIKETEARFADSRTCPALAVSIRAMANLPALRIEPPVAQPPKPSKHQRITVRADGSDARLWSNAVSIDGKMPEPNADLEISNLGDGKVLKWAEGVVKALVPCWTDSLPAPR